MPRDAMIPVLDYGGMPLTATASSMQSSAHVSARCQALRRAAAIGLGMTSITKPPGPASRARSKNALGLTQRDYEGAMSTLCAGCGHDSVTAALVQACWELALPPHRAAKMSGIGCSSKTTAYFMRQSHGFNSVHGRMPSRDDRRERRESRSHLHRHLRRRRFAVDRTRPALSRDPPQRAHAVRDREQRRLRTHEGPVLGVSGHRLDVEEGRSQRSAADRSRAARAHARRDVRRAQLLRATRRSSFPSSRLGCRTTASR